MSVRRGDAALTTDSPASDRVIPSAAIHRAPFVGLRQCLYRTGLAAESKLQLNLFFITWYTAHARPTAPANDRRPGNSGPFNCDGYTFAAGNVGSFGYWSVLAVLPNATSNYSVRLYDRGSYGEIFSGFDDGYIAVSEEAAEPCDFVLVNTRKVSAGTYYPGVVNLGPGFSAYRLAHQTSVPIQAGPSPDWDEVRAMPAGQCIDLYEVYLTPGNYTFSLRHLGANASLGLALFHCNLPTGALPNDMVRDRGVTPGDR